MDKELYEAVEAALNVYLDAARKCVGSPSETPVGWRWLNQLGDRLKAIFPYHPELGRCCGPKTESLAEQQCNHAPEFLQTITNNRAECMRCGKIMKLSWDGGTLVLKEQ